MLVYYFVPFIVSNLYLLFWVSNGHNSVNVQNRTHVYMNFFDHKDLGNHLLQLCPKVVKHPVYYMLTHSVCSPYYISSPRQCYLNKRFGDVICRHHQGQSLCNQGNWIRRRVKRSQLGKFWRKSRISSFWIVGLRAKNWSWCIATIIRVRLGRVTLLDIAVFSLLKTL